MTLILDGKLARSAYAMRLKSKILELPLKSKLVIIQIGDKEESNAYIKSKIKFGEDVGVEVLHIKFSELVGESEVIEKIEILNKDKSVNGIIVQLPIPDPVVDFGITQSTEYDAKMHYRARTQKIIDAIISSKDVDGLTTFNVFARAGGDKSATIPATARGVMELLEFYKISVKDKKVAILGRSILAGNPIKEAVNFSGGIVTICHSQTSKEEEVKVTRESDIAIVAIGKPKFLTKDFFTIGKGQVVVDVGINRITNSGVEKLKEEVSKSKFVGDVDFDEVSPMVSAISPVPGGVGQMTVLALFENLYDCVVKEMQRS